jgi:hypothetical protein
MAGRTENFTPRGQLRPWGSKFAPKGEVKNGPLALAPRLNNLENCRVANFFLVQQTNLINNLPTWPQKIPSSHKNGIKIPNDQDRYQNWVRKNVAAIFCV